MTDFYPDKDRMLWPVAVNTNNNAVTVIEDPGGANEATITATLTTSDQLDNGGRYFCFARNAAEQGTSTTPVRVVDDGYEQLYAASLYAEIAKQLTDESAASGNGLTYFIEAITPAGSDHDNTGLRLDHTGSRPLQLDFSPSGSIDPRFFGWGEGDDGTVVGDDTTTSVDGPYSRWGVWYSPVTRTIQDKRTKPERRTFDTSPEPRHGATFQYGDVTIPRPLKYVAVPGVHIWPDDRAGRTAEADRGGVPTGDANNVLKYVWDHATTGKKYIIIGHGDGEEPLGATIDNTGTTDSFETGRLMGEWRDVYDPQDDTELEHAGEKYDPKIMYAANKPEDATGDAYRH
jgi:hypothetical protein